MRAWGLCLSVLAWLCTRPSLGLFLSPPASPMLSLCLLASPPSLLHPLLWALHESPCFPSLPFPNTCPLLSQPPSPSPPLSFLSPLSVWPVVSSLSPHLPVLGPHPFLTSPVCPHHPLCLPQLSGKAVVIYELWTGPAAGAGGPDYGFPEEAACLGWQSDSVYRATPAQSSPVRPRRMECWRRPVTSFTPLRANNKTLTHGLDTAAASPRTFPAGPRGQSLGSRDKWSQESTKSQASPKPPTWFLLGL